MRAKRHLCAGINRRLQMTAFFRIPIRHLQMPSFFFGLGLALVALGPLHSACPAQEQQDELSKKHCSYKTPQAPDLPQPKNLTWAQNTIDLFVLDRLETEGLAPAPAADRATLIRRLALDLIGLPPSPQQVKDFVADPSPWAYEKLVDRLLASPHYGERQARPWLDLARYADTNGFEKDHRRVMWRYRDWVIAAFNDDMGFDRFTIEQLAGDLLPNPDEEQLIATGFHRNTMINAEGGIDPEEARVAAVVDRTNTTATVWLGLTMACAQCHTHKFDSITHEDYFKFFAYFNSTTDIGPSYEPQISVPSPKEVEQERKDKLELAAIETTLSTWTEPLASEFADLAVEQRTESESWQTLHPVQASAEKGTTLKILEDGSILASGKVPSADTYFVELKLPKGKLKRLRLDVLTHKSLPGGGSARSQHQNFVLNELEIEAVAATSASPPRKLSLKRASADFFQTGKPGWPP
ncbi:MAG: DUF1549 domain-containing protein [Planctomycetota bacterium]